jgi:hypothetical protein
VDDTRQREPRWPTIIIITPAVAVRPAGWLAGWLAGAGLADAQRIGSEAVALVESLAEGVAGRAEALSALAQLCGRAETKRAELEAAAAAAAAEAAEAAERVAAEQAAAEAEAARVAEERRLAAEQAAAEAEAARVAEEQRLAAEEAGRLEAASVGKWLAVHCGTSYRSDYEAVSQTAVLPA